MLCLLQILQGIECRGLLEAVFLAEILHLELQAPALAGVVRDFVEVMQFLVDVLDVLQRRERDILYLPGPSQIDSVPELDCIRAESVPSRSSCLLEIGFRAFRKVIMDDESHIRLVDSHSESICADHHTDRAVLPQSLAFGPGLPSQTRVVEAHRNPRRLHHGGKFLALASVAGIDYSAPGNPVADVQDLSQLVFGAADNIGQVRPLEPALEKESVTETQFFHDIVRHDRSGCRSQGYDRGIQGLPQFADPEIVRAEIIAPLGNAVSLIDNDITYIKHVQIGPEQHRTQSFR